MCPHLVNKCRAFYETGRFITAFTSARHLSLSCARSIQSMSPHPTSWTSILLLSSHLGLCLENGLFHSGFPCMHLSSPPYMLYAPSVSFFLICPLEWYLKINTDHKTPRYVFFSISLLRGSYQDHTSSSAPNMASFCCSLKVWYEFHTHTEQPRSQ